MLSSGYMSQIIQDKLIDVKLKINEYEWITSFQISHCFPYLCNLNCIRSFNINFYLQMAKKTNQSWRFIQYSTGKRAFPR